MFNAYRICEQGARLNFFSDVQDKADKLSSSVDSRRFKTKSPDSSYRHNNEGRGSHMNENKKTRLNFAEKGRRAPCTRIR